MFPTIPTLAGRELGLRVHRIEQSLCAVRTITLPVTGLSEDPQPNEPRPLDFALGIGPNEPNEPRSSIANSPLILFSCEMDLPRVQFEPYPRNPTGSFDIARLSLAEGEDDAAASEAAGIAGKK